MPDILTLLVMFGASHCSSHHSVIGNLVREIRSHQTVIPNLGNDELESIVSFVVVIILLLILHTCSFFIFFGVFPIIIITTLAH